MEHKPSRRKCISEYNKDGRAAAFGDDIAIEALAIEFKRDFRGSRAEGLGLGDCLLWPIRPVLSCSVGLTTYYNIGNQPMEQRVQKCTHLSHLNQLHAFLITFGQAHLPLLSFKLLRFCITTLGAAHIDHARLIFDHNPAPSVYHWTAIITAYAQQRPPACKTALYLYKQMHFNSFVANQFTVPYILKASAQIFALLETAQTHAHIAKSGLDAWAVVRTALVDAYAKCGVLEAACRALGEMREPNVVSFTALLTGEPPAKSCDSGVHAFSLCTSRHTYKRGSGASSFVSNALIDMYAKCGCLKEACKLFDRMRERSGTAWNSMINGLALHGHTREAIEIFNTMQTENVRLDEVTFVRLLNACTHGGLIDEGCSYFLSMKKEYGLEPRIEHYGCVVDLLGRAGRLEEAIEVIEGMNQEPDDVI
ncbi:hypothetical protein AMTRI_Chr01g104010 [Amborella trichopoda]